MAKNARWVDGLNYVMIAIFLLAVIVQYNDADAGIWMIAYGIAAVCCVLWRWTTTSHALYAIVGGGCVIWGIYLLIVHSDQLSMGGVFSSVQMKNKSVEIIREAGGLFIIAIWMTILTLYNAGSTKQ